MACARQGRLAVALAAVFLGLVLAPGVLRAGTTGKLTGAVRDQDGKPVVAATVIVGNLNMGAYTDTAGSYTILNIPAGTYAISGSRLGYRKTTVQDVIISADRTTDLDLTLQETAVEMKEVVVTAERPPVDLNKTSSEVTITSKQIESLPVQDLNQVVELQAGVVNGHFRGGRQNEVQYQVDGVTVNNAFNNESSLTVDRSLLEEVQVISGTFDAEYGQAMSGVVNAVLKEGTRNFRWGGEAYLGGYLYQGNDTFRARNPGLDPSDIQSYRASLSGPAGPNTTFLLSGRRYIFDDYIRGERRFTPFDTSDVALGIIHPTGDGKNVPLAFSREWSGAAKLTNTSLGGAKLSYQAIWNIKKARRANWAFRFNPDGLNRQKTYSVAHGLDWTQTLSSDSYFQISLRQNYFRYTDYRYQDAWDPRYDAAGPPDNIASYEDAAIIQGVDLSRYLQETNTFLAKGSVVSQVNTANQIKVGGEVQLPRVTFGSPGYVVKTTERGTGNVTLLRYFNYPPSYLKPATYYPLIGAAYAQDQAEWKDLKIRAGLRLEYFDSRATVPSDLSNPANAIQGAPESHLVSTTAKLNFAPRLGVAYPIEDKAAIHFAYGHFYQYPAIGDIFTNADYQVLANLQSVDNLGRFGIMGNPDVKAEKTVQYEFGYKHNLTQDLGVEVTAFYKDIRNLLGIAVINTYNDAQYVRLANADFGNVLGFTLSLSRRHLGPADINVDYTWQRAQGNASNPQETASRADAGEDARPRVYPFDWDQRHSLKITATLSQPGDYTAGASLVVASGQPYTPELGYGGFGVDLTPNSGRKPAGMVMDLRAEKTVPAFGKDVRLFARVFNLFDTAFLNGAVFASTGSPYYARVPTQGNLLLLSDPTRFYAPRRVEFGFTLGAL